MDIVYLCRDGDNEELRYSLRSIKNLAYDKVWLFGGRPYWYQGLYQPMVSKGNKHANTTRSLRLACMDKRVSDPFILMNDDFFILKPTTVGNYDAGDMDEFIQRFVDRFRSSRYIQGLKETCEFMKKNGIDKPLSYELHVPIVVHKKPMLYALKRIATVSRVAYRSAYGNFAHLESETIADVKIHEESGYIPTCDTFMSTDDTTFKLVKEKLAVMFPEPSPFEQWT